MAEVLPTGYTHETYMRLKRLAEANPIEGKVQGQVQVYTDLNAKVVTGTFSFPIEEQFEPNLNAYLIKASDYAQ